MQQHWSSRQAKADVIPAVSWKKSAIICMQAEARQKAYCIHPWTQHACQICGILPQTSQCQLKSVGSR